MLLEKTSGVHGPNGRRVLLHAGKVGKSGGDIA